MLLDDVWRKIGSEVGFHYHATFHNVPIASGVYAWFYPLRLLSRDPSALEDLVGQVHALLNYDVSISKGELKQANIAVGWWDWHVGVSRSPKSFSLSDSFQSVWKEVSKDDALFSDFQQSLLKASVLMPPLYVGKANNLNIRCRQHLDGTGNNNDFHKRFEEYARDLGLPIREVRQLIFACVKTNTKNIGDDDESGSKVHELLEALMKSICTPPYGIK